MTLTSAIIIDDGSQRRRGPSWSRTTTRARGVAIAGAAEEVCVWGGVRRTARVPIGRVCLSVSRARVSQGQGHVLDEQTRVSRMAEWALGEQTIRGERAPSRQGGHTARSITSRRNSA
eukprot:gene7764-biopygen3278